MQHWIRRWIPLILLLVAAIGYLGLRALRHAGIVQKALRPSHVSTDIAARRGEIALLVDPGDLGTRQSLILYYEGQPQFEEKREKHVLWMIMHHPESDGSASPAAWLTPDEPRYAEAKALWLRQVDAHVGDVSILSNAASALRFEPQLSRELADRALAIKPDDPASRKTLAESYTREMRLTDSIDEKRAFAGKALRAWEQYAEVEPDDGERQANLREFATTAFEAGKREKANQYATNLLDVQQKASGPLGPDPDAIHIGNTILGLLALDDDNVTEAKRRLLASAPGEGSPVLSSYGPRMTLAAGLLRRGQRDVVIAYLERCRRFWDLGKEKIPVWESDIQARKKPAFGDNLRL